MQIDDDPDATGRADEPLTLISYPRNSNEFITLLAHYYRAEIARMAGWRDRIDRTTNWAITVVAAMLSVSLSSPTAQHGVLLFAMLLILLLLVIESRRYRFFDVYRSRVRRLERNYFAQLFTPERGIQDIDWTRMLSEDLKRPLFLIGLNEAVSRRLRRNYSWMFLILLLAWMLKITATKLPSSPGESESVSSIEEWLRNSNLGPLPGWFVIGCVAAFYGWILYAALRRFPGKGELAYGDVHV